MTTFTAACIQTNSHNKMDVNISESSHLIRQAHQAGAELIALPENVTLIADNKKEFFEHSFYQEEHPGFLAYTALAQELAVYLLVGSLTVKVEHSEKLANRSILINPHGEAVALYDKIHLFDVDIKGGERHQESERIIPGQKAVLAGTPWCKMGLTICYDVRFPQLFRTLAQAGASLITVPAAFTYMTGKAHWEILLRARAIENSCYIIAPGQCGHHPANRRSWGHSMIIDPWGEILAEASEEEPGIITAEIDLGRVETIRASLPSLQHDKEYEA